MNFNNLFSSGRLCFALTLSIASIFCASSQAQFHGGAILKTPLGPDGTDRAHVGDTITATITVMNLDDFGDTLTITGIWDTNRHALSAGGDMATTNLLPHPITLDSPLVFG